jgi:hypothetical protein
MLPGNDGPNTAERRRRRRWPWCARRRGRVRARPSVAARVASSPGAGPNLGQFRGAGIVRRLRHSNEAATAATATATPLSLALALTSHTDMHWSPVASPCCCATHPDVLPVERRSVVDHASRHTFDCPRSDVATKRRRRRIWKSPGRSRLCARLWLDPLDASWPDIVIDTAV